MNNVFVTFYRKYISDLELDYLPENPNYFFMFYKNVPIFE